ncbi:MAG: 5-formyltetrahydrofolate cyclo-ligase [Pedobacter sp.]|nr:MAG: 5-formyltetrahydrofolate cyclo-ligase [Pedobacter sp.]
MQKSILRKAALAQRLALTDTEYQQLNESLLESFKTLSFEGYKAILVFLPIKSKKEPDTFLLINWLKQKYPELKILVPAADFNTHLMTTHYYTSPDELILNAYGIPEPSTNSAANIEPDLVLIPLLAFDKQGYRVGYGKGFYDRYLAGKKSFKLGISFFPAQTEIKDVHLNDIKLDACLTPTGILYFNHANHGKGI